MSTPSKGQPGSPKLEDALDAVRAALREEIAGTPEKQPASLAAAQAEIDSLRKALKESQTKEAAAQKEVATLRKIAKRKGAAAEEAQKENEQQAKKSELGFCASLCKCFSSSASDVQGVPVKASPDTVGDETAETVPKITLAELLQENGFGHIAPSQLGDWSEVYGLADDRLGLINHLKSNGVTALKDRQGLATTISRAKRENRIGPKIEVGVFNKVASAATPPRAKPSPKPAGAPTDETASTAPKYAGAAEFLSENGFGHIEASQLGDWSAVCGMADDRAGLLAHFKAQGIKTLKERQGIATAIAKAKGENRI